MESPSSPSPVLSIASTEMLAANNNIAANTSSGESQKKNDDNKKNGYNNANENIITSTKEDNTNDKKSKKVKKGVSWSTKVDVVLLRANQPDQKTTQALAACPTTKSSKQQRACCYCTSPACITIATKELEKLASWKMPTKQNKNKGNSNNNITSKQPKEVYFCWLHYYSSCAVRVDPSLVVANDEDHRQDAEEEPITAANDKAIPEEIQILFAEAFVDLQQQLAEELANQNNDNPKEKKSKDSNGEKNNAKDDKNDDDPLSVLHTLQNIGSKKKKNKAAAAKDDDPLGMLHTISTSNKKKRKVNDTNDIDDDPFSVTYTLPAKKKKKRADSLLSKREKQEELIEKEQERQRKIKEEFKKQQEQQKLQDKQHVQNQKKLHQEKVQRQQEKLLKFKKHQEQKKQQKSAAGGGFIRNVPIPQRLVQTQKQQAKLQQEQMDRMNKAASSSSKSQSQQPNRKRALSCITTTSTKNRIHYFNFNDSVQPRSSINNKKSVWNSVMDKKNHKTTSTVVSTFTSENMDNPNNVHCSTCKSPKHVKIFGNITSRNQDMRKGETWGMKDRADEVYIKYRCNACGKIWNEEE